MDRKNLAFDRMNFILLAVGMVVVIIGFILMSGGGTDDNTFNPEIFSAMRIKVAPVISRRPPFRQAAMKSLPPTMNPASTSPWPLIYLVALCTTTSAPSSRGRWT